MTYAEKLKDPRWQKKRLEVFDRDGWTCMHCHSKEITLHVHHLYYTSKTDPWDYPLKAYLTLCQDCHEVAGENTGYFDVVFKSSFDCGELALLARLVDVAIHNGLPPVIVMRQLRESVKDAIQDAIPR